MDFGLVRVVRQLFECKISGTERDLVAEAKEGNQIRFGLRSRSMCKIP